MHVFTVFHLNLAYSSIEEDQRQIVIERCYRPLLDLADRFPGSVGIELSGFTLEEIARLAPDWVARLRQLIDADRVELIGSGYAQLIGPLVPADVNAANLGCGHDVYERLAGRRPRLALVNEQAYSAGLVRHYLDAGYAAIIMEWDNPASRHPEWDRSWRYLPQIACGIEGEQIPVVWDKSIAFQQFQRYAHGEAELDTYLGYLASHLSAEPRALALYANDAEVFDFRPGRYRTEPQLGEPSEWARIATLFERISRDREYTFVRPSQVLELLAAAGAAHRLRLESPEDPVPVKKQGKYNVTRWAVTGRDDVGINTRCWQIYQALRERGGGATRDDWRELCYLWSSDFRTHITEARWPPYVERLERFARSCGVPGRGPHAVSAPRVQGLSSHKATRHGHILTVETDTVCLRLNCRRGLAVEGLVFKRVSSEPLCGTLGHGYYDDIRWGADYYTAHLVLEAPGRPKVTDLSAVDPAVTETAGAIEIAAVVTTDLGPIDKRFVLELHGDSVRLEYAPSWAAVPIGSLRLGYVTLVPSSFANDSLFYRTANGGTAAETFPVNGRDVEHGASVSFLVSAATALGLTDGAIELGDAARRLRVEADKCSAALVGMVSYHPVRQSYFYRVAFSASEVDETRQDAEQARALVYRFRMSAAVS